MIFNIRFAPLADMQMDALEENPALKKRCKAVSKAIAYLQSNPRHPGLNTHKFHGALSPHGGDVFEAYAENRTPGAYRIFWCYGPGKRDITVLAITPHP